MLSTHIKNTCDLMTIALQAEREAIRRYSDLATIMRAGKNETVAELFDRMVTEEREHERLLMKWMKHENLVENPDISAVSWRDPQVSTIYDDEALDPDYSTPYKALAFAVHNEEIAFRFYTHVAADSKNKTVRRYAEILAREELGHAAMLRAERRRAYHAERNSSLREPKLDAGAVHNKADLLAAAIRIDQILLDSMNVVAPTAPEIATLASETQAEINRNKSELKTEIEKFKTELSADINSNLEQIDNYSANMATVCNSTESRLHRLHSCCDRSFVFYDAIVASSTDEAVMLSAQQLASAALDRIGVLKRVFGNTYLSEGQGTAQTTGSDKDNCSGN